MGNYYYTQLKQNSSHPEPPQEPQSPDILKINQEPEEDFLQEFDNPSRGVLDHSFLKTDISASNQRLSLPSIETIPLSRTITPKTSLQIIERSFTPSQAPSVFHMQSSEVTLGKEEWSELVCWQQKNPTVHKSQSSESDSQQQSKKSLAEGAQAERYQKRLQQNVQQQDTASTIIRQLSGYILTQKNMFEPIKIKKESFVKFREEDVNSYYIFLQKIGEGSYGKVFRAIHKRSKIYRAIKVLKRTVITKAEHDKIMNEINILKKLDHPHIIKIFQIFFYDSNYYIVTEYCEGGSLSTLLKNKILTLKHAQVVFAQLANALAYLHSLNIVHRDIKLDNILVTSKVTQSSPAGIDIRLIDFGLAKEIKGQKLRDRQKIGTYTYMAPEVLEGFYTPKCDVWSAGIVLFYLIAHHHPFKGASKEETFDKISSEPVKLLSDRWKEVKLYTKQLVFGLLQKNYRHRLSSQQALRNPWLSKSPERSNDGQNLSETIKKLADYHRGNNLISMIESYIVYTSTTQKEILQISRMFDLLDRNHDGLIEQSQLQTAFKASSNIFTPTEINYIIQVIEKQHEGKINYTQFVTMLSDRSKLFAKQSLIEAFEYFDSDKNGFLEKEELRLVLKGGNCEELSCILSELDSNDDNRISLEEFVSYLRLQQPNS